MFIVPEDPVDTLVKVSGCDDDFDLDVWSPSIAIMKEAGIINEIENRPLFTQLKKDQNGIDKIATRWVKPSYQIIINQISRQFLNHSCIKGAQILYS